MRVEALRDLPKSSGLDAVDRVPLAIGRKGRWPTTDPGGGIEDAALLILEWLGEQGINTMLRVDAERLAEGRPFWTFAASGGPLEIGMRADGASAALCLSSAVARLRELGVVVPH
ncbi:hypothetical protein [Streptosporangium sandarakinum]|uniref:hypothetical protein n=1 Tax=Streptosporangium sandarakinum TaxID=1260955 RepID=UPI0037B0B9E6